MTEMKKSNLKLILIIVAGILAVVMLGVFGVQSSQNKAFSLEEQVNMADSDIKVQEKRRVDLVYNLADCVKQYDKHEADTLTAIVECIYYNQPYNQTSFGTEAPVCHICKVYDPKQDEDYFERDDGDLCSFEAGGKYGENS